MRKLQVTYPEDEVLIADEAFALDLPPVSFGLVPSSWSELDNGGACVPEIDFEFWANAGLDLTGAELYAANLHPLSFTDLAITAVDAAANNVTSAGHGKFTGDGPVRHASDGTVVAGLEAGVDYWLIKDTADKLGFATSLENAMTDVRVDITGAGTGNRSIADTASTKRVHWHSHGLLGPLGDGEINLDEQRSYFCTRPHRSRIFAYAVVATLSVSDPEAVSISMWPTQDR